MKFLIVFIYVLGLISANIKIISPASLKEKFKSNNYTIDAVYGNFGHIPYGQSIVGHIYYNKSNSLGCKQGEQFTNNYTSGHSSSLQVLSLPVYLVERGECHFTTKVRNIAREGGAAAIIVDNNVENINKVMMSDDGTGAGIRIPSLLIGNESGEILMDFLKNVTKEEMDNFMVEI